jgi:DNA replication protein DnaC
VTLLIIDDFALQALDELATADFYELVVARHRKNPTIVTSNRTPDKAHLFPRTCVR